LNLTGTLSSNIGLLTALTGLLVARNELLGTLPSSLSRLIALNEMCAIFGVSFDIV